MERRRIQGIRTLTGLFAFLVMSACADDSTSPGGVDTPPGAESSCSIPENLIFGGGPGKDGIPALTNPPLVRAGDPGTGYLDDDDRVVGLVLDAGPIAIPLNILWWHEIVNLDGYGPAMAITHCPLTGSSLAFDRTPAAGAELGVSGLLYRNNLIMYDRNREESLWPQMLRGARCGPRDGTDLPMIPIFEMTWGGWTTLHPETLVVSENTGSSRDYTVYPYGGYDALNSTNTFFPTDIDPRRPPKERVLGIPLGTGGLAFPFGILDEEGPVASVAVELDGDEIVVFWDRSREAAMAFEPWVNTEILTFAVSSG
ncbi:MAG: DUF3179 domain-containing protein, partial [Gemmatimonadetes bacterium]|nr:DUF3179 domain-containing protein [Gemmatimonadota bacterium]